MPGQPQVKLAFSDKYDQSHAQHYLHKHQRNLSSRLSHSRDVQMLRRALKAAGNPASVLDLPCGAGRFWPLLAEHPTREIWAADNSADMIAVAESNQPAAVVARVKTFQTSAFAIDLGDSAVDCISSIRLMHHVADSDHRLAMLREFHRVSRDSVIISLWVDGNFKAWRRKRLEQRRARLGQTAKNSNRFVISRCQFEQEAAQAGFRVIDSQAFLPGYAMWRMYTLRKV